MGGRATSATSSNSSATQIDTSGGSTETDVNELAAMPTGWSSTIAQTAITPHGKQPKTRRSPTSSR
ncbi:hypothetical protein MRGA423_12060 [Mycobacterium tuberculosis RGTB423]|nr:hypothetical protein MRGA423_12060 [Mycobacterium tuberculosis RGTB423]